MKNLEQAIDYFEREYNTAMNDVMGLSRLVGDRNAEINDLNYILSQALEHLDKFPKTDTHSQYSDGAAWDWDYYEKETIDSWIKGLRDILGSISPS